jgi:rod shape-determining protein MreD
VKAAAVCLAVILALAVQTTMLPFALGGRGHVDLVLVVVIYAALQFGPATGLVTGAVAGMAQDALSGGVIGVGGIAKTIVGFLAGAIGSQFIVANAVPRFVVLRGHLLAGRLAPGAADGRHRDYPDTDGTSDSGVPDAPAAPARVLAPTGTNRYR